MNTHATTISRAMERKGNVRSADPARTMSQRLLGGLADNLSRRNLAAARAELLNEALHRLAELCYEVGPNGWWNVDPVTLQILIPVPMSGRNYGQWGLRRTDRDALRCILTGWQMAQNEPLFWYETSRRRWHIDVANYARLDIAQRYLQRYQITAETFQGATDGAL